MMPVPTLSLDAGSKNSDRRRRNAKRSLRTTVVGGCAKMVENKSILVILGRVYLS